MVKGYVLKLFKKLTTISFYKRDFRVTCWIKTRTRRIEEGNPMIKIAICDDDLQHLERAQDFLAKYLREHPHLDIRVVSFSAPLELLTHVEDHGGFDVYLLDVFMAGFLGTESARQLRQIGDKGEIIFLTSSHDHALEAFEVEAAHYLTKPYTESAFFFALDKIFKRLNVERRHFITVKTAAGMMRLFTRDVVFTESGRNNYQIIHLYNREKIEVRITSVDLFELLSPSSYFVKCGVSINLNLKYVRQITKDAIIFDNGEHIAYPYRAYQKLKEDFLSFQLASER